MSTPQTASKSDTKPVKRQRLVKRIEILADGWPRFGLLRCDQIVSPGGPLPLSKSQFWVLVKKYELTSVMLSSRVTAFWVHDLRRVFFGDDYALHSARSSPCVADSSVSPEAITPPVEQSSDGAPPNTSHSPISKATVDSDGR